VFNGIDERGLDDLSSTFHEVSEYLYLIYRLLIYQSAYSSSVPPLL
jgi:hypothetical protein